MLAYTNPDEAYRRSELDARVRGSGTQNLVLFCCEQVVVGLDSALLAHRREDRAMRSRGLTRALSALTALEMGIDREHPLSAALTALYAHARRVILDAVIDFGSDRLRAVRTDFDELASAFSSAA